MNNMKIEPGCMAVIINNDMGWNGKACEVIYFIGEHKNHGDKNWAITVYEERLIAKEYQLMRIDGFKEDADIENEVKLLKQEIPILIKKADKQIELLKTSIASTLKRLDE